MAATLWNLFLQEQPFWEATLGVTELQLLRNLPSRPQALFALLGARGGGETVVDWALATVFRMPRLWGTFHVLPQCHAALQPSCPVERRQGGN